MDKPEDQIALLGENLRTLGASAGVPSLPAEELKTPKVYTGAPPAKIVRALADLLGTGQYGLYRRGLDYGTIEADGEWIPMDPERMATWLPIECGFLAYKSRSDEGTAEGEFSVAQCRAMLASDQFRRKIPRVRAIHPVRLPVFRDEIDGRGIEARASFRKIELLPVGYDRASEVYTLAGNEYPEDMDPDEAWQWIYRLLAYFPWGDAKGRSLAVQVAGMLSAYCRLMYAPGRSPLFCCQASMEGSGKTNLGKLMIWPTFRSAAETGYSHVDKKSVRDELDSLAMDQAPYVFYDDVPSGIIRNSDLNKWVSGDIWQSRIKGGNQMFRGRVSAMTVISGNQITLSPDLARRALIIDLDPKLPSKHRKLPEDAVRMTPEFFLNPEMMTRTTAALWALVRNWDDGNRPRFEQSALAGFDLWAWLVPNIVQAASFGNPCAPVESDDLGDKIGTQFEALVRAVAAEHGYANCVVPLREFVGAARRNGLFVEELWTVDDVLDTEGRQGGFRAKGDFFDEPDKRIQQAAEWMDAGMRSKWGKMFRRIARGRHWLMEDGTEFKLGDRTTKDASKFALTRVEPTELPS